MSLSHDKVNLLELNKQSILNNWIWFHIWHFSVLVLNVRINCNNCHVKINQNNTLTFGWWFEGGGGRGGVNIKLMVKTKVLLHKYLINQLTLKFSMKVSIPAYVQLHPLYSFIRTVAIGSSDQLMSETWSSPPLTNKMKRKRTCPCWVMLWHTLGSVQVALSNWATFYK